MNYSSHCQWSCCKHSWAVSIHIYTALCLGHSSFKQFLKHGKAVGCFPFVAISPKRGCLQNPCKCLPSSHLQADLECLSPQIAHKMFIITGSNKELCFIGCFWLQPQVHLFQPRPFVARVDIQCNSTLKNISVFARQEKYTNLSMHLL